MEYTTLGSTGLSVSRICVGCMSFGAAEWGVDAEEARAIVDRAVDLGVNFFDTANTYAGGDSERILGDALAGYDRDWLVPATKVHHRMREDDPNSGGLSRKAIEQELAHSLERLGMDTVDLYQIHRWDDETPIAETLRTLDDLVRRGRVRYLGASSMWAHQFAGALHTSDRLGLERFVSMQNHYNLVYREEEREMLPLCRTEGIGVVPWSPLAAGYLARPHDAFGTTVRGDHLEDHARFSDRIRRYQANGGAEVNARVEEVAADHGVSMAQIGLAWLLHQDGVDAPIVGTTSVEHLEDAVEAVSVDLTDSELAYLAEPYEPKPIEGHD